MEEVDLARRGDDSLQRGTPISADLVTANERAPALGFIPMISYHEERSGDMLMRCSLASVYVELIRFYSSIRNHEEVYRRLLGFE